MPISEAKHKVAQAISLQRDFQSRLMRASTGMIECFGSFASPGGMNSACRLTACATLNPRARN
jgi:hypothetical protein